MSTKTTQTEKRTTKEIIQRILELKQSGTNTKEIQKLQQLLN
jgi:hypothetical protein